MQITSDDLLAQLAKQGIDAVTHDHPPVHTVEESRQLRGDIPGIHTKNLFLRDSKKTFFLVVADEAATVNLKDLRHKIGAKGNLSFGAADALLEKLGVTPGSVSLLALINDTAHDVTLVVDQSLLAADIVNCHPITNARTTSLSAEALRKFFAITGHAPLAISLDAE